ncbi:2-phosphoglycolate phosphatase [Epithele typhae]|uniref:2-phosphoglycolate phosphatase n=1 Tax=Epithele typhae TaxID=378194 RepID=UPI002008634C|nr:2-phosphoglycolate phosphatase [Epithele typhae]KAH9929101.1 2-phosphoglycolate phosphatase [Epithele typhae]
MAARLSTREHYADLLDKYDTWLFDCDGVLWQGDRPIEGVVEVLQMLRKQNKAVIFVTNNATKSRPNYKKKFDVLGVEAHVDEIYGSAYASAVYISSVMKMPKDKKVYVIGMPGLEEELRGEGIQCVGGSDPADNVLGGFSLADWTPDPAVGAVLCGLDTNVNYTKLSKAFTYLQRPGVAFLATNEDSTYPSAEGLLPGAGAVSAPLRFALGADPLAIGKPKQVMLDCIRAKHDFDPKRTIMVGDRLNTDIEFGKAGGLATLLVLTGITKESEITGPNASSTVPDYVTSSLGDLRALF